MSFFLISVTEMSKKNRKRKLEEEEQSMVDWEQENIFPEKIRNEMESMWEVHISIAYILIINSLL